MNLSQERIAKSLARRNAAERRFRWYGRIAVGFGVCVLLGLVAGLLARGYSGFTVHEVKLTITQAQLKENTVVEPNGERRVNYTRAVNHALGANFPEVTGRGERFALYSLLSSGASLPLRRASAADQSITPDDYTLWIPLADQVDMLLKGHIDAALPEAERPIKDLQIAWVKRLQDKGLIERRFNRGFFSGGDSREPELAGFWGSMAGSLFTLLACFALAFPLGVLSALYLEEFAPRNRLTDLIEVNINNLAAVPSIIFGLLGLALFLNVFGLPRSSAVAGGLTLSLMILPVIIITTRASLKAVPSSIREAARGLGASPLQVVADHVVPYAMPGIMTGTILGMARAIGETAPLLMIGMVAFVADVPRWFTDPASAMPVQIYLWASSPEMGFIEKTSAGIIVLLAMLLIMNSAAIYIRKRFEIRW